MSFMEEAKKPDSEWNELSPELYHIAREKGTEAPFSGKYTFSKEDGIYKCAVCGNPLFSSDTKFDSGTGWPSFTEPISEEAVEYKEDLEFGMKRTEVLCARCGAHLGHVFNDGPKTMHGKPATGQRYCLNSVCLNLQPQEKSK